ncbi:NADPH-dependent FMN reductase [Bythopirellula polymerisocia]|uniref:FMN-dependent NADPH-azoreductase n=1 Tax=Bythopirellula polymerisocia TaxID=2528003 RepID=A0A5C6CL49_9BACT|nr:NAD(P)H-dependent oxidoreductase [Bythopirellula polymerisocia]TWU25603.1 FMN-dependent NADPH-azoreductase [Bythopirellula polymerisocia]
MKKSKPRILAFAGSARKESHNKKLVRLAATAAEEAGAEVTLIDLADYPLPIMDEDLEKEQGLPANATKLKELFLESDGLMISCPEYNSSITPLLKNTIDWVSRPVPGEPRLAPYIDKVAVLMAASPGALGGLRGLVHVRAILQNIGVTVLPDQRAVSQAHDAFDEEGKLKDSSTQEAIAKLGKGLADVLQRLARP